MEFKVVIPARYESSRLPGKVLMDIHGKSMLAHVYERAVESGADQIIVATDDDRIRDEAKRLNAEVCMTAHDHPTGTHRIAEAVAAYEWDDKDVIVNLQADEPMVDPRLIKQVAEDLVTHDNVQVATVCEPITDMKSMFDPAVVKVVLNHRGYAMYFSRAPIPYDRSSFADWPEHASAKVSTHCHKHLGLYAYRVGFLPKYLEWEGCPEESLEVLEQLRVLWYGAKIHVAITKKQSNIGVDTPEDLEKVRLLMKP
jgi:3-deoxy-manno-octulosonate cytidylyltransferase (CMP-KDO synthetase)